MKTYMAKKGEVEQQWLLIDATNQVLGRLATQVARILMGKHRPEYTPHVDTGDFVVIVNADKIKTTGSKSRTKAYQAYSGYPSGLRITPFATMKARKPEMIISEAVRRMLPKSKLGDAMLSKLKVYAGGDHPHQAQQPQEYQL